MRTSLASAALAIAALSLSSPAAAQPDLWRPDKPDVVIEWNAITLNAVATQNGVEQVRLAAITHLAMFEAVNAISGEFRPYLGTVVAAAGASPDAAAIAAAHGVLWNYLVDQRNELETLRAASLAKIPDGPGKTSGIAVGEASARDMVLHRENDGSQPPESYEPESTEPGHWQQTPSCKEQGGLFLHWRNLKPFGIERGDQFRAVPPPELASRRYARHYNEVKAVGGATSEQRSERDETVARFYAAALSQVVWNAAARQLVTGHRLPLAYTARLFALLNMAMNDALIAVMDTKYHYTFWRPETAIRAGDADRNDKTEPDTGFEPLIATPCHPSYLSAHASSSNAAREVLERHFGDKHHLISLTTPAMPGIELQYTRLSQITHDIDIARIYGGIHYRFDQQAGARQGRRLGAYVVRHHLRPAHHADARTNNARR
jgi:hypothetical protein